MNKKVIAMAIAAAMVAPLTAQAEDGFSIGGAMRLEAGVNSNTGFAYTDKGGSKIEMKYNMGGMMAKYAIDMRDTKAYGNRDVYIGMKFGDWQVTYGSINQATKNLEKDPFIATIFELRGNGNVYQGSGGYSEYDNVQVMGKVGEMTVALDTSAGVGTRNGTGGFGLGVKGANWFAGYDANGVTKAGIKLDAIDVGYDANGGILLGYTMDAAGGMVNVAYGSGNGFYRVAWKGKAVGTNVHAGIVGTSAGGMTYGAGVTFSF